MESVDDAVEYEVSEYSKEDGNYTHEIHLLVSPLPGRTIVLPVNGGMFPAVPSPECTHADTHCLKVLAWTPKPEELAATLSAALAGKLRNGVGKGDAIDAGEIPGCVLM